ncbi:MAG: hypothetical protein HYV42_03140 [Candidatus Magasanikbacteria bacterium]|nr:hypothetical protein [Candidatus Magasanikbacteria bacterium]
MPRVRTHNEPIERVTLKLPKSIATYFRQAFGHGRRSEFVANCLRRHRQEREVAALEEDLRGIGGKRV